MDRIKIKNVGEVLDRIFSQHKDDFEKAGIKVTRGNSSFNEVSATIKVSVLDLVGNGQAVDLGKLKWEKYSDIYGMKKEWYGKSVKMNGRDYTIVGLEPKKRINNVIVECNGKKYLISPEQVTLRMNVK